MMESKAHVHCPVSGTVPEHTCFTCKYFSGRKTWTCTYRRVPKVQDARARKTIADMRQRIAAVNKKRDAQKDV